MITIFAGLATFERHLIKARTDEGRKRAQARGVRFGRPLKLTRYQIEEALARREALAGNQRTMPVINGSVTRVSADITREQQNSNQPAEAYYTVRIALPADELVRLHDIRLVPGMPAEVFIQTHERTPLQYLLKPLREQIARTFRER